MAPQDDRFEHKTLLDTALPYISNYSLVTRQPHLIPGSLNIRCATDTAVRRGGLVEFDSFVFPGTIKRIFSFQRIEGASTAFYIMVSVISTNTSSVYKKKIGADLTFSHLFTDSTSNIPFDYVEASNWVYMGNDTLMRKYDGTNLWIWGIEAPGYTPTFILSAGTLSATSGYRYVYAWGRSQTAHIGAISGISANTGVFTNQDVTLTFGSTADTQVDEIHVYRTTDGGGDIFFELPNSPMPYSAGASLIDSATDINLSSITAPERGVNDPPPPGHGFQWYQERIWYFKNQVLVYTGNEEIINGVTYESVPALNFRVMPRGISFLSAAGEFLIVGTSGTVYRISGDSLDTFRFERFLEHMGARTNATATSYSRASMWLDSSDVVRVTDGLSQREISYDIRPDLEGINHSMAQITAHDNGVDHLLVLQDGASSRTYVYDFDSNEWQPPWTWKATSVYSGETSSGRYDLLVGASSGKILRYLVGANLDDGVGYQAIYRTNLIEVVPPDQPSRLGYLDHIAVEHDSNAFNEVRTLTDDNPITSAANYVSILATQIDAPLRVQGQDLVEHWFYSRHPTCRRVSISLEYPPTDTPARIDSLDIAWSVADR